MNAEDFIIDDCCDGKIIKNLCECSPYIEGAILFNTLVVEAIYLCDESGLVVASKEGDSVFISNFEGK